jgi:inner membrane protein
VNLPGHTLGGAFAALAAAPVLAHSTPELGMAVAVSASAARLCDWDHPKSAISRDAPVAGWLVHRLFGHRGATHSALAVVVAALPYLATRAAPWLLLAGPLGIASHVLADALTHQGIPLWWPVRRRVGFRLIRTGGVGEWLVSAAFVAGIVWFGAADLGFDWSPVVRVVASRVGLAG